MARRSSDLRVRNFCQLLGAELLALEEHQEVDDTARVWLARAAGFEVARRGEAAIRDALDRLASRATGHLDEPRKAFGDLLPKLSREYLHEDGFAPFRSLLRNCILDIWPVAAGDVVVGEQVPERRLHSLISASRETGIGTFLLSQFLIEAGAISEDDDRPTARKTFDARRFSALLEEIPTLVGRIEMQRSIRATRHQFQALVADGVLIPRTGIPTIKSPWRLEDGSALISELLNAARPISPDDEDWEHIHRAHTRSRLGVGVIVEAIRSGRLTVGQLEDLAGYGGIFVLKRAVDGLAKAHGVKAARPEPTAAEFGRSVGMRDGGRFMALLAAGHSSTTPMTNPKTGATQFYMTEGDVEAFHARFLTLPTMAAEFGEHRRTLLAKITAAGIKPFGPDDQDYGHLYLRERVEPILR